MTFVKQYIRSVILIVSVGCIAGQKCMSLATNGYTVPQGDIILPYGSNLSITCHLHKKVVDEYGRNASSRLFFKRNNVTIPKEMVTILNETSVMLYIENHPMASDDNYYCNFNGSSSTHPEFICFNVVIVGVPPQDVTDFSCLSRNSENLTCTWTAPDNKVKTDYKLIYYINSRSSRKNGAKRTCKSMFEEDEGLLYSCPEIKDDGRFHKSCFWNISTKPQYRPVHDCIYFELKQSNTFGNKTNTFTFDHFKHVLPNPPENFTAVATSPHSIHLSWAIPTSMLTFLPGLEHRILYQCQFYEKKWHFGGLIGKTKNKTLSFELKGLKYAHALCDIRVSMRSAVADKNDESMWSENAARTVRTLSKRPDCPPATVVGGFQVYPMGGNVSVPDIYIYWHQIDDEQQNGQNFSYDIEVENHPYMKPIEFTKAYARFTGLARIDYVINLWSVNEIGRSEEKSKLFIPSERLDEPSSFIKVAYNNNSYELSWEPPSSSESLVTNYTIFWCPSDRDRPYQCMGNMNWKVVRDIKKYHLNLTSGIYQFAISANSLNSSSGMRWAECTIVPNRGLGRIGTVWINDVKSTSMELNWSLDCIDRRNDIIGYIISYCRIDSPTNTNCKDGLEKSVTINGDVNTRSGIVKELTPYTSYRLRVSYIIDSNTFSQSSRPLYNATREDVPDTPPLHVQVYNITNSSVTVKWEPPTKMNGVLRDYVVVYNDRVKTVQPSKTEVVLTDLMSYELYDISVKACTVNCSQPSNSTRVFTKMGLPGELYPEKLENNSKITIMWEKPIPARGPIDYYQVNIRERLDEDDPSSYVKVNEQFYTTEGCASGKKPNYISVRAVNVIDNKTAAGPWSKVIETSCVPYTSVTYVLVASMIIFLVLAMGYGFKRLYMCYNEGRKFEPALPSGLLPNDYGEICCLDQIKEKEPSPPADAERLLQKNSDIRLSGDSSGCSSGHESITSSLESTAHISPSDSGTEQPRSPSLGEERRKNSLRQRNVSVAPRSMNLGYVTADTLASAKPPTASPENYCVLGVNPSTTKADPPYVPITDLNTKLPLNLCDLSQPPPYVMTGDLVKSPNPGYVPYSVTEPGDKNMGYVVAGLPKDLLPPDLTQCDSPKSVSNEEKPLYVRASDSIPTLKPQFPWQQPQPQLGLPKSGYVSVGDAPPPKPFAQVAKGYVPHRQFEGKSLKED